MPLFADQSTDMRRSCGDDHVGSGLKEIIHCDAPAGVTELASRRQVLLLPEVCDLPIWLFTGVRCGDWTNPDAAETCDMMRGEETLCLGLAASRPVRP